MEGWNLIMTGKQHVAIGTTIGFIGTYYYLGGNFSPSNVKDFALPIIAGSVLGSWAPDVDSKKSKGAQIVNNLILLAVLALSAAHYLNISILNKSVSYVTDTVVGNLGLLIFIVNVLLGRLSSHRQYTHRVIGTAIACVSAYMAFPTYIAVGYIIGYVSHILADRFTAAGKHLNFFRLQLPMFTSKGKFHVSL